MRALSLVFVAILLLSVNANAQMQLNFVLVCSFGTPENPEAAKVVVRKEIPNQPDQLTRAINIQPYQYDMLTQQMNANVSVELRNHWLDNQEVRVKMLVTNNQMDLNAVAGMLMRPVEEIEFVDLATFLQGEADDLLKLEQYKRWLIALAN